MIQDKRGSGLMRKFSAPELRQIIILYSQLKKNRRKGGGVLVEKERWL